MLQDEKSKTNTCLPLFLRLPEDKRINISCKLSSLRWFLDDLGSTLLGQVGHSSAPLARGSWLAMAQCRASAKT